MRKTVRAKTVAKPLLRNKRPAVRAVDANLSVCESIIERIKEMVRGEHYQPGSKLPGERELAEQLGVSRASVREALRTLALMGLLETRPGSGTQVSANSANLLKTPFELLFLLDQPSLHELYETRELLEVHLAGRAAERRTEEDLVVLKNTLSDMLENLSQPQLLNEANVRFHEAIAAAAHHSVLERIIISLHEGIRLSAEATQPAVRDWQGLYEVHERIYQAIERGNVMDARRAMTVHMAMAFDELERI